MSVLRLFFVYMYPPLQEFLSKNHFISPRLLLLLPPPPPPPLSLLLLLLLEALLVTKAGPVTTA